MGAIAELENCAYTRKLSESHHWGSQGVWVKQDARYRIVPLTLIHPNLPFKKGRDYQEAATISLSAFL